jgi:hypothetical protein
MLELPCPEEVVLQQILSNLRLLNEFTFALLYPLKRRLVVLKGILIFPPLFNCVHQLACLVHKPLQSLVYHFIKKAFTDVEVFFDREVNNNLYFIQIKIFLVLSIRLYYNPQHTVHVPQNRLIEHRVDYLEIFTVRIANQHDSVVALS